MGDPTNGNQNNRGQRWLTWGSVRTGLEIGQLVPIDVNKIIQGLWIGSELSVMEQSSISSFLQNGHDYHLYVYDDLKYIPAGTVVMDASEILPSSRIFQYKQRPSYAGFSNFFRYKLLFERGGWWADSDTICLKPFDFPGMRSLCFPKAH